MPDAKVTVDTPRTRSPLHRTVYSNQINSTSSDMEITLRFGIVNLHDTSNPTVEDQIDVVLNPIMVVKLRNLLTTLIDRSYTAIEAGINAAQEVDSADAKTE